MQVQAVQNRTVVSQIYIYQVHFVVQICQISHIFMNIHHFQK